MGANLNQDNSFLIHEPSPQIYVACLASYNAGALYGKWFDATLEVEDMLREIKALLAKSPMPNAEEFAIHGATRGRILKSEETLTLSIGLFPIRRCTLSN